MATPQRPTSPFTTIYRWQITMTLSFLHRITGVALAIGAFGVVWWLVAVAGGGDRYADFMAVAASWPGRIMLIGFSYCLIYHLLNGLRHMLWDSGRALEIPQVYQTGWTVVAFSILGTAALWWYAFGHGVSA
jgi:succinate dehydrogenase / fumarate reductase cytochrome b subunit